MAQASDVLMTSARSFVLVGPPSRSHQVLGLENPLQLLTPLTGRFAGAHGNFTVTRLASGVTFRNPQRRQPTLSLERLRGLA